MNDSLIKRGVRRVRFLYYHALVRIWWLLRLQPMRDERLRRLERKISIAAAELPPLTRNASGTFWFQMRTELRRRLRVGNLGNFLNWPDIQQTMFYEAPVEELNYLKNRSDWSTLKKVLREPAIGNPRPYARLLASSGNSVHLMYSMARFEEATGGDFSKLRTIVEFGGGYGDLCRLAYARGFVGQYVIFDLPEFSLLQEYYLSAILPQILITKKPQNWMQKSITLINTIAEFKEQLRSVEAPDALIALWSLSETPVLLREQFLAGYHPKYFLFGYQERFEGVDNHAFFTSSTFGNKGYEWTDGRIEHVKQGWYRFGARVL